jgi:hypothetical protein
MDPWLLSAGAEEEQLQRILEVLEDALPKVYWYKRARQGH